MINISFLGIKFNKFNFGSFERRCSGCNSYSIFPVIVSIRTYPQLYISEFSSTADNNISDFNLLCDTGKGNDKDLLFPYSFSTKTLKSDLAFSNSF